jgi:hypothetical protein
MDQAFAFASLFRLDRAFMRAGEFRPTTPACRLFRSRTVPENAAE